MERILARNRSALYPIVIAGNVTEQERYAADELRYYLERMTSAPFTITTEPREKGMLAIGHGAAACLGVNDRSLGDDGFLVKTTGSSLAVIGGKRGVIYGVYELLERLGCRFFTATCEKIPTSPLLALPDMETRQIPVLEYRDHNYYEFTQYSRFAVKMRLNGHFSPIREKHGGSNRYVWFCHTFDLLVPTELYADTHPEYYALIGGVRKTQKHCTQLCLTNPDVLEISIASVREALKANPEARIISITQNDWGESCQCDACRAADEEEHSPSGTLLRFVNAIAQRLATETAKLMKATDPSLELVACGSSGLTMGTFGAWEHTVLRHAYDQVEYISLHSYYGNYEANTALYLAKSRELDSYIEGVAAICDAVKAERHSEKTIYLSLDEWNVWYRSGGSENSVEHWQVAPPIVEDVYNFEDALMIGCLLLAILRHADRVKMACLAQLVNVIAPIMTEPNGPAWAQTIYYPFQQASRYGRGVVLRPFVESPTYDVAHLKAVPYVEALGIWNEEKGELTVFAVNRSETEPAELEIDLSEFPAYGFAEHLVMAGSDKYAVNTAADPYAVVPSADGKTVVNGDTANAALPPFSWNVIRFEKK